VQFESAQFVFPHPSPSAVIFSKRRHRAREPRAPRGGSNIDNAEDHVRRIHGGECRALARGCQRRQLNGSSGRRETHSDVLLIEMTHEDVACVCVAGVQFTDGEMDASWRPDQRLHGHAGNGVPPASARATAVRDFQSWPWSLFLNCTTPMCPILHFAGCLDVLQVLSKAKADVPLPP
jgi:hypothetical protein